MRRRLHIWPRSLFGRNVLLILAIIVVGQLVTIVVFLQVIQKPRAVELADIAAAHIKALGASLLQLPPYTRDTYIEKLNNVETVQIETKSGRPQAGALPMVPAMRYFLDALTDRLGGEGNVIWQNGSPPVIWLRMPVGEETYWVRMSTRRFQPLISALWVEISLVMSVLAMLCAYLIQRRLNRPLRQLATAVERVGAGDFNAPLSEDLPTDLVPVGRSFNTMANRLARIDAERGVMLAGVSYDLQMPLENLRRELEQLTGTAAAALKSKMTERIDEMNLILGQFVEFAGRDSDEAVSVADLNVLIHELVTDFARQGDLFHKELEPLPPLESRPMAMRRLIGNLMQNAVRHAGTGLEIHTRHVDDKVEISVLDRGPGLPADQLERIKQPFTRLNEARNSAPGAGLGLAIADRVARLHGGELILLPRDGGGLEARVVLPA